MFRAKIRKYQYFSAENSQFFKIKKSLFIAWASFRNEVPFSFRFGYQVTTVIVQSEFFLPWLMRRYFLSFEPPRGNTDNVVSEQVCHKPACTATVAG